MASESVGMPSPERDPITIISVAYFLNNKLKYKLFVISDEDFANNDDSKIIQQFIDFIKLGDFDIITTFNGDAFDWKYIQKRCGIHNISLNIGRDESLLTIRDEGKNLPTVNIVGRLNVDLYKLAKRELQEVKVKKLENVAEYLGVIKKSKRTNLTPKEITFCWHSDRNLLYKYARDDVVSTLKIAMKMLPAQINLSNLIGAPLDELCNMGRGRQVENYLTYKFYDENELMPYKRGEETTFEGAFVLKPTRGVYNIVSNIDYSALYPNIIIKNNISPDTYVEEYDNEEDVNISPEVGHAFRKSPDGIYKKVMTNLLSVRQGMRAKMKELNRNSSEYKLLDLQQYNFKVLSNSFWGFIAWPASKLFNLSCAEAITAYGRLYIKQANKIAEDEGFKVLYTDTDGSYLTKDGISNLDDLKMETEKLITKIKLKLDLDIKADDYFKSILFTGMKKRYAAINEFDERVDRGLEVRRGDWTNMAKELQSTILDIVLRENNPPKALHHTNNIIKELRSGNIDPEKLVIWKTLTREITDYQTKQPHVIAAKRALSSPSRIKYAIGSKVPYVIFRGTGKVSDRAFPFDVIDEIDGNSFSTEGIKFDLDKTYYEEKQIRVAALRILEVFGYTKDNIGETQQKSLTTYTDI